MGKASNACNTNCLQELGRCFVHVQVRFVCWAMMPPKSPSILEGIKRTERKISRVELIILVGFFLACHPCTQVEKVPFDSCKQSKVDKTVSKTKQTWRPLLALHTSKPNVYQKAYLIFEYSVDFRVLLIGLAMSLLSTKDKIYGASCLEWEIHWMGSMLSLHRTLLWITRPPKCSESPHNS